MKSNHNFNMYIHPFELSNKKVDFGKIGFIDKFRFNVGRNNNLKKLEWLLNHSISNKFKFISIKQWINKYETIN